MTLSELEREYIERVLQAEGGNKTRAAQRLGLDRKTLYRKLEEYERSDPTLEYSAGTSGAEGPPTATPAPGGAEEEPGAGETTVPIRRALLDLLDPDDDK
jgi:hypothetical protein